ncbi:uncharacterized protein BDZ99DRAFT_466174 [Mytilinidion resinicola]|uniref:BTB domain-containing protein n=1 Tax=Mytilinidion resinicola TaxID=574789 RepID=A0A6A6YAH0_9PEZI|nr:uncharacterized protein BDZ99DRAFT_466174 [Mytilinidion resinicola]KAF2805822.1 hypothetical protein BDZ99DRAFT_466174 [Mytilinidion resinicola]
MTLHVPLSPPIPENVTMCEKCGVLNHSGFWFACCGHGLCKKCYPQHLSVQCVVCHDADTRTGWTPNHIEQKQFSVIVFEAQGKTYHVHLKQFTHRSPELHFYITKALRVWFAAPDNDPNKLQVLGEGRFTLRLPNEEWQTLRVIVAWLYKHDPFEKTKDTPDVPFLLLAKVWLLADKLGFPALQNQIIRRLYVWTRAHNTRINLNIMNLVYKSTWPGCKLRKFMACLYAQRVDTEANIAAEPGFPIIEDTNAWVRSRDNYIFKQQNLHPLDIMVHHNNQNNFTEFEVREHGDAEGAVCGGQREGFFWRELGT